MIKNLNLFTKFYLIIFLTIKSIKTQILDLPIGKEEIHSADFEKYFKLDISESSNHKNLIFYVGPKDMYENWSDPDIYISKVIFFFFNLNLIIKYRHLYTLLIQIMIIHHLELGMMY
jgi:hypothetical protein